MNVNFSKIDISVIIVNYKSWYYLKKCIDSIHQVILENLILEIIIIDNFSNDGQIETFKKLYPNINFILNNGNNGFANGCNLGAKNAKGEYLLFLNPDTIVTTDPILKMYNYLYENQDCGIVSCNQKKMNGNFEKNIRFFPDLKTLFGFFRLINKNKLNSNILKKENVIFPNWVSGAVVFISRKWFDKIHGWNEDYWMYYEDVDLSKKVTNCGGKVALLINTEIIHNHGGSSRINLKTASITKTEVLISKHVYIFNNFNGFKCFGLQFILVLNNLIEKFIISFLGIFLLYIPKKIRLNLQLLFNLIKYYFNSIKNKNWLSYRSMNYKK